jgi:sec-independent protein translocase protein TatC
LNEGPGNAQSRSDGTRYAEGAAAFDPSRTELRMTFLEHLGELGARLKKALLGYILALVLASSLPNPIHPFGPNGVYGYNFLLIALIDRAEFYYLPAGYKLIVTGLTDPVFAFMNVSLVVALVASMPYIFYQVYGFVAPGLYQRERKAVRKYLLPFTLLLTIGCIFGLFIVFPLVMKILILFYQPLGVISLIPLDSFVNLLILVPVMTGLAFTFPVFLVPLVELRVLSVKQLTSARKWVYVLVALAVSLANPDPTDISSVPIVVPILVLYEITILVAKRIERGRARKEEAAAAAALRQPAH